MTQTPLSERQRAALRDLKALAATRARAETETEAGFRARGDAADGEFRDARRRLDDAFAAARAAAEAALAERTGATTAKFDQEHGACANEYGPTRLRIAEE